MSQLFNCSKPAGYIMTWSTLISKYVVGPDEGIECLKPILCLMTEQ